MVQPHGKRTWTWARPVSLGTLLIAACVAIGACGSNGGGSTGSASGSSSGSSGASASACVSSVKAQVASDKSPMPLIVPTTNVAMAKNKGKTIWFISPSQATGYALGLSRAVQAAGAQAGMKVTVFDARGQPDQFTQGLLQAAAQGAGGVILYGIDPALVPEGLARTKAAGIPVVAMSTGRPSPGDGSIAETLNTDLTKEAQYMANYAAFATGCKVDAATAFDTTYAALLKEHDVIKTQLATICPSSCKVQDQPMKLAQMATALGPSTQSLIQRNPSLNIIFATFDQAATYQIPAVEQSGSKAKIVGTNGLPENLAQVRKGSAQIADVSYVPPAYFGWLGVDQLGRAMLKQSVGDAQGQPFVMPVQTFDRDNLPADTSSLAAVFPKLAGYQAAFRAKWGQ